MKPKQVANLFGSFTHSLLSKYGEETHHSLQIEAMWLKVILHALKGIKWYHNARSQGQANHHQQRKSLKEKLLKPFVNVSGSKSWLLPLVKSITFKHKWL